MRKKLRLWVADFEAVTPKTKYYQKYEDTLVYKGGYVELYGSEDSVKLFSSVKEFIALLKSEYASGVCYFHNLNFDGDFIYKWFLNSGIPYLDDHSVRKVGYHVRFVEKQIYEVIYNCRSNKRGRDFFHKIYFKCSWRLLSASVEKLGETYKIEKHKFSDNDDFYDNEPDAILSERFIEYLKNDIIIVKRALLDFEKGLETIKYTEKMKKWYRLLTIGSLSYKIQKHYAYYYSKEKYNDKRIVKGMKLTNEFLELANKFYYGGWTHFNLQNQYKRYTCKGVGVAIDINSAHPAGMRKLLPFGEIYKKESFVKSSKYKLIYYHIKVKRATAKYIEVLTLKNWKEKKKEELNINGRYCIDLKNFECYYLKEEWELLQHFYNFEGVKIIQEYWCNADYYLKDYVDDLYKMKSENKGNSKESTYKILLNSGYGKHAQRKDFNSFILIDKKDYKGEKDYILKDERYIIVNKQPLLKGVIEDTLVLELRREELNKYGNNKLIAATITAYTRITLWNEILHYGPSNFLYGDTDSLRLDLDPQTILRLDKSKIGKFSMENVFTYIEVAGAKRYRICDENNKTLKYAFGGINKKFLKTILEEKDNDMFTKPEYEYFNAKLSLKRCKSGSVLESTTFKANKLGI